MKSVLISIQPYWVFLIIAKTMGWNIDKAKMVEVRKNYPKDENWDKVAKIYCSKDKRSFAKIPKEYQPFMSQFLGKVMGEFVCDKILDIYIEMSSPDYLPGYPFPCTGLTDKEILQYLGNGKTGYGWHISDLVIYDKPRELREFKKINRECWYADLGLAKRDCPECKHEGCFVQKPPQSWCYVEEGEQ